MKKKNKGGRPKGPPTKVVAFRVLKKKAKPFREKVNEIIKPFKAE